MKGRSDVNMIAKVKLIFYAVLVFSIYLFAIFYSFGDHELNLGNTSTKQTSDSSDESVRNTVQIKCILMDSAGNTHKDTDVLVKNTKSQKKNPLKIQTNAKGEVELKIRPGSYLFYLDKNHSVQKQVKVTSKENGKLITLKF